MNSIESCPINTTTGSQSTNTSSWVPHQLLLTMVCLTCAHRRHPVISIKCWWQMGKLTFGTRLHPAYGMNQMTQPLHQGKMEPRPSMIKGYPFLSTSTMTTSKTQWDGLGLTPSTTRSIWDQLQTEQTSDHHWEALLECPLKQISKRSKAKLKLTTSFQQRLLRKKRAC